MAITNAQLAQQISNLVDYWRTRDLQFAEWLGGTPTGGPFGDGRFPLTDYLGVIQYLFCPAALEAGVTSSASSAAVQAALAGAAKDAALVAQAAAESARDLALSYQVGAQTARAEALMYRDTSASHAANALVHRNAAAASATASATAETNAEAAEVAAEAARDAAAASATAADASADAAAVSAALAATFNPALYATLDGDNVFDDSLTALSVRVDGPSGSVRDMGWLTNGVNRWFLRKTSTPETGANAGSNFEILARDDAGASLGTAFSITRATRAVSIPISLSVAGVDVRNAGLFTSGVLSDAVLSSNVALRAGGNTFTANQVIDKTSSGTAASLRLIAGGASQSQVIFDSTNGFYILDALNAFAVRLSIDAAGLVTVPGDLRVNTRFRIGSNAPVSGAAISAAGATAGNSFEWGHSNAAGYRSTLGYFTANGRPFLAFNAEHGTDANTFRTRGIMGRVIQSDLAGGLLIGRVTDINADNQTLTSDVTISNTGAVTVAGALSAASLTVGGSGVLLLTAADNVFTGALTGLTAPINIRSTLPGFILYETDAVLDAKAWRFYSTAGALKFETRNDASTGGFAWLSATRNGAGISALALSATALTFNGDAVVVTTDARLSDARTPLSHTHTIANVTGLQVAIDAKANLAGATFANPIYIETSGNAATNRNVEIKSTGQSNVAFGAYLGAWRPQFTIQGETSAQYMTLLGPASGSADDARIHSSRGLILSGSDYLKVDTVGGIQLRSTAGSIRGYVYQDGSGFGLLGSGGSWAVHIPNGTIAVHISGDDIRSNVYYNRSDTSKYLQGNNSINTYGTWRVGGSAGGYTGITLVDSGRLPTFMSNGSASGIYNQGTSAWDYYNDGGYFRIGLRPWQDTSSGAGVLPHFTQGQTGGRITVSTSAASGTPLDGDLWIQYS